MVTVSDVCRHVGPHRDRGERAFVLFHHRPFRSSACSAGARADARNSGRSRPRAIAHSRFRSRARSPCPRADHQESPRPAGVPHSRAGDDRERESVEGRCPHPPRRVGDGSGRLRGAILAYEGALELEPNNFEVKILMTQVASLSELEARKAGQRFQESSTELTTDGSPSESRAAELIIEILPSAPNPGDPYVLRVRAHNLSNQGLALISVELIDTHASMNSERGRPVTPLAQRLGPKETALLWERRSDWTAADRKGSIDVVVTLADGSRLSKSLRW